MAVTLRPVGDNFILIPDAPPEETEGGLVIPAQAQEKPKTGEVLSVGQGLYNSLLGQFIGMPIKKGDRVIYKPYAGLDIDVGGEKALLLKSEDILAVIEEVPEVQSPKKSKREQAQG